MSETKLEPFLKDAYPISIQPALMPMVIEKEKTMTRRLSGLKVINENIDDWEFAGKLSINHVKNGKLYVGARFINKNSGVIEDIACPYPSSSLLWIKEKWRKDEQGNVIFYADSPDDSQKWKSSRFMRKEDAKRFLSTKDIGIGRVQDISRDDIIAEGIRIPVNNGKVCYQLGEKYSALSFLLDWGYDINNVAPTEQIFKAFWAEKWCEINGPESWNRNDWCWIIKFNLVK